MKGCGRSDCLRYRCRALLKCIQYTNSERGVKGECVRSHEGIEPVREEFENGTLMSLGRSVIVLGKAEQPCFAGLLPGGIKFHGGKAAGDFKHLTDENLTRVLDLVAIGLIDQRPEQLITINADQTGNGGQGITAADAV